MRKVVRLTESDLVRIVKRVIRESEDEVYDDNDDLIGHYSFDKDRLDTARFIPNQKGTEKGHSMGANTPERSYKKPSRDSGMGRLMAKDDFARLRPERMKNRRDEFDLNENDDYDDDYTREMSFKDKKFKHNKSVLEKTIERFDNVEKIIKVFGGEDFTDKFMRYYKPLGLTSVDELIDYKGGYPEDEY